MKENILIREAVLEDIPFILSLLKKYHINTISNDDINDGFVTTNINEQEFAYLITKEQGVVVALNEEKQIIGFIIAGSWEFLKRWPMFNYMVDELHNYHVNGTPLTPNNSYQYGPICVDKLYRNHNVAQKMKILHCEIFSLKYNNLATFVNVKNTRSMNFHINKLNLFDSGEFDFNGNRYKLLSQSLD